MKRKTRGWRKLKPLEKGGMRSGCLNCGPTSKRLKMNVRLYELFFLTKGKKKVMSGDVPKKKDGSFDWDKAITMMKIENIARRDPNHSWKLMFCGYQQSETYQRHGRNLWVLVRKDMF